MTEELILTEESVVSEEQAACEEPVKAKKAYITPQMEIEYFDIEDVIATSGDQTNFEDDMYGQTIEGDYTNDPF